MSNMGVDTDCNRRCRDRIRLQSEMAECSKFRFGAAEAVAAGPASSRILAVGELEVR